MKFSRCCFMLLAISGQILLADFQLLSNYTFNNSFSDSLGNSANLVPVGAVTLGAGSLAFDRGEGFSLGTTITSQNYAIEMDVQFTDLNGWNKLIDFQSRTVDAGFYINPGNQLTFFNFSSVSPTILSTGTPYTLRLERQSSQLIGYINGAPEFTETDSAGLGVSATNQLNFFLDDLVQDVEYSAGTITGLRLYVSAVPEPSSTLLACLAASSLSVARRFRRATAK